MTSTKELQYSRKISVSRRPNAKYYLAVVDKNGMFKGFLTAKSKESLQRNKNTIGEVFKI